MKYLQKRNKSCTITLKEVNVLEIKDIIKNRRIEIGLTMLDVSKKVGVSEATISRWESGDIANMKRDKIVLLAEALELSPAVIMGWEEPPQKSQAPFAAFGKDDSDFSEDEIKQINNFIEFVKKQRNQ